MRRVFKTRPFSRWMRKCKLTQEALCLAISEMENGLIDAELGGGVVKKRVPLPGRGKSGGTRTLLATNKGSLWFFVFGFEKTERANISLRELEALKAIAADLLKLSSAEIDSLVDSEALEEICHEYKDQRDQPDPGHGSRDRA
ncbi:MAG TPA: type II toxin-antitoxin system RelE/ParE family toxin [Thermoanaerobaculia bacterium]|nr:type II toxin-antitoxin system RelE/ParE family toxin [Thermoanaerobaculia bacterium]